jgi:hypothetical protein
MMGPAAGARTPLVQYASARDNPSSAQAASGCTFQGYRNWVEGSLNPGPGVTLKNTNSSPAAFGTVEHCKLSGDIRENWQEWFDYGAIFDTSVNLSATINDGDYSFSGYAKHKAIGDPEGNCQIRNRQGTDVTASAPYSCTFSDAGSNGRPYPNKVTFTVGIKPTVTVTDVAEQGRLAEQFAPDCRAGKPTCSYKSNSKQFIKTGNEQISDFFNNCSSTEKLAPEQTVEWSRTIRNSFNFKVAADTGAILSLFTKATAEAQYNHAWEQTEKFSEKLVLPVPPKQMGAWFYAAGYDRINGNFTFSNSATKYIVPNAVVDLPNRKGIRSNVYAPYNPSLCEPAGETVVPIPSHPLSAA